MVEEEVVADVVKTDNRRFASCESRSRGFVSVSLNLYPKNNKNALFSFSNRRKQNH